MKNSSSAALAIGAGYLLGRTRKLRWAVLLAAAMASGGLPGRLAKQGGKLLGSSEALSGMSPGLSKLSGAVKGDLADAGKAAAKAAVSNRIATLTESLHERAEGMRGPVGAPSVADGDERTEADGSDGDQDGANGHRAGRAAGREPRRESDGRKPAKGQRDEGSDRSRPARGQRETRRTGR